MVTTRTKTRQQAPPLQLLPLSAPPPTQCPRSPLGSAPRHDDRSPQEASNAVKQKRKCRTQSRVKRKRSWQGVLRRLVTNAVFFHTGMTCSDNSLSSFA